MVDVSPNVGLLGQADNRVPRKVSSVLGDIRAYLGSPQSRKVTFGNSCYDGQYYQGNSRRF